MIQFDIEKIKQNIDKYSSIKIADMIIANRYFGVSELLVVDLMSELSNRRLNGNDFDYESYIEENLNKLPKLEFKISDLDSIIGSIKGFKRK